MVYFAFTILGQFDRIHRSKQNFPYSLNRYSQGLFSSFPSVAPKEGKKGDPVKEAVRTQDQVVHSIFFTRLRPFESN